MYGRMSGWEADKLTEEQLKRKQQLCEEVNFTKKVQTDKKEVTLMTLLMSWFQPFDKRVFPGACCVGRDHAWRESDEGGDAL